MLLLGLAVLVVLLHQIPLEELWTVLREAKLLFLLLAVLCGLVATVLRALRYGAFFPPCGRWLQLYGAFSVLRCSNMLMPMRSGELFFFLVLKKYRFAPSIAEMVPVWLLLRAADLGIVAISLAGVVVFQQLSPRFVVVRWGLLAIAAPVFLSLLGGFIWLTRHRPRTQNGWLGERFQALQKGVSNARGPVAWLKASLLGLLIWTAVAGSATCVQVAFGTPLPLSQCGVAAIIGLSLSVLPIHAPLGIGTGEAAWTLAMISLGVPTEPAIVLAIAIRLYLLTVLVIDGTLGAALLIVLSGKTKTHPVARTAPTELNTPGRD